MLTSENISFIGGGVMCEAIINCLMKNAGISAAQIAVAEPITERRVVLAQRYGIEVTSDNGAATKKARIVILSVKPQVMGAALGDLKTNLNPAALVISIAAGVQLHTIMQALGDQQPVVRVMPNTPAQIGQGMSVWTSNARLSDDQHQQAKSILASMGHELYFEGEHYLDMATAISGSGPAYVFLFMEAIIDAAVRLGFSRPIAQQLVEQTVKGSIAYAVQSDKSVSELRNQVTSPGGTTAAALYALEKGGLRTALADGVMAAYQRGLELGKPHGTE